jgi:uncharacterized membrane protein HdeD (DUF308 family)
MATIVIKTTNENDAATEFAHRWGWLLALGIVQIIAGTVAIAVPVVASLAAVAIFGALLIVTAVFQLIHAFQVRAWPRSAWYGFSGVLYAVAGFLVVLYPLGGALALAVLIGVLLIADGALRTMFGMIVRPVVGWGWLIASGIGSVVVGVILLTGWPATALWVTGLLLGVSLIFSGAMNTALALASRASTHQGQHTSR